MGVEEKGNKREKVNKKQVMKVGKEGEMDIEERDMSVEGVNERKGEERREGGMKKRRMDGGKRLGKMKWGEGERKEGRGIRISLR